ncbi:MAG: poly-beta-1,6-N-acetyl-D-glucosamine N-deacetylase PgaB [Methylococcaceae bacterium]|jgi:biofilm PGA synthesis lipoprotein PgaB
MMNLRLLLALILFCFGAPAVSGSNSFIALNYHDIIPEEERVPPFDRVAVSQAHFESHFAWLKKEGYRVVGFEDITIAAKGGKPLPDKAVLLTFDDGYKSFYTRVFPLLKKYHYPAVVALVGAWMESTDAKERPPNKALLSWAEVRELKQSGLVEIASHSYDLHRGITANPQGNEQAAATTHAYDTDLGQYEDDEEYRQRVHLAISKSANFIWQQAGIRPRVMVWPFGEYNDGLLSEARAAGMPFSMALWDGTNTLADLKAMRRLLIADDPDQKQFAKIVKGLRADRPLRVIHIDLDAIDDKDKEQTEKNLGLLVERIRGSGANTVFLQAFADPDGDGNADALYFPNRHLPVKSDLFSRAAWQLKTRAGVKVYAWMPMMAFKADLPSEWRVMEWRDGKPQIPTHIYQRISPFSPEGRRWVGDLFEDLAKHCSFDGLLFHDDGILSDFEDVSPAAITMTHDVWGLPDDFAALHGTPAMRLRWARLKTDWMMQFTDYLTERSLLWRPYLKTARNLYALPVLMPDSEEWYAQSLDGFLKHYDYVAIEAMPFMEKAENPDQWLKELGQQVAKTAKGFERVIFELQPFDWNTQEPIAMSIFTHQMEQLKRQGAHHLGYYPDNLYANHPDIMTLQKIFKVDVAP